LFPTNGGSRGGGLPCHLPPPQPPILGKKEEMTRKKKPAGQVKQNQAPSLTQGLDLPLTTLCQLDI